VRVLDPIRVPLASTTLIEASAGTGKTYTITTLYLRCLLELPLDVRQILVVTYTNAATAELRDRVRQRIRDAQAVFRERESAEDATLRSLLDARRERGNLAGDLVRLTQALQDFDEAAIFTIHGFCRRMLQENAFESRVPFDTELAEEQELLRDEVARDFVALRLRAAPEYVYRGLQRRGVSLARLDRLAKTAGSDPSLPVLPETVAPAELDLGYADWRSAFDRVAGIWSLRRQEVLSLLTDRRRLKGTSYRRDRVEGWARTLDGILAGATPGRLLTFKQFEKFTTAGLRAGARDGRPPRHELFAACDDLLAREEALDALLDRHAVWLKRDFVDYARREIQERKEAANRPSFDDLLHRLAEALADGDGAALADKIAERFRAALIDEFQDTDPVQYEIFRRIYHGRSSPLFLIGDPKQAIYSFRGADVYTYMAARGDARERRHTLDTNYRSDVTLIRGVNALFRRPPRPFLLDRIDFRAVKPTAVAADRLGGSASGKPPLEILLVSGTSLSRKWGESELPRLIAAEIARFLGSGATIGFRDVGAGDVAVLCRTNQQAKLTHAELQRLYVPCVLQGDSSVLDTEDAEEVERVLLAMADPADAAALRSALATRMLGLGASDLCDLQRSEAAWDKRMQQFTELADSWSVQGFVPAFRRMLDSFGVQARLLEQLDGERRLTNVLHLGELLQNASAESHRGPLALVEWLHRMRNDAATRADLAAEAEQIRLESDAERVKVTTIHQAKGLEYPIVYCPFSWGKLFEKNEDDPIRFHDPHDGWRLKLDLGSGAWSEHREQADLEDVAESLRLLYVALTRAKHRCSIVWGAFEGSASSALGYLLHRPRELPEDASLRDIHAAIRDRCVSTQTIRADLERLVDDADGAVTVSDLVPLPAESHAAAAAELPRLAPRPLRRPPLDTTWRVSSFSALTSGGGVVSEPAEEGMDRDEAAQEGAPAGAASDAAERIVLWALPRGARTGDLVHEIFEHIDFTRATEPVLESVVAAALERHGFAASWNEVLCGAVREVFSTPLGGEAGDLVLGEVSLDRRLSEMEFLFPVANGAAAVDHDRLAAAFRSHWALADAPDYPERIGRLRFRPLAGFLRGFIDLVFEHDGRWYVVDYKSSFLGAAPVEYRPSRLVETMAQHHFFLQYHLYVVALHRHLRSRVAGYDYERSFGGVYYLFVRGMSPRHPRGYGVFHDRPARALIEELSGALAPR
jgi:exodeoxyribonuclease V beta subunit